MISKFLMEELEQAKNRLLSEGWDDSAAAIDELLEENRKSNERFMLAVTRLRECRGARKKVD